MTDRDLPVAIAGGGICGLATALALAQHGMPSHVLERRATFPEDGAGIQIGPNGTKILEHLGLSTSLRAVVAEPDALSVRDGMTGHELTRLPFGGWIKARHGSTYWTLHRQDLHAALLERARNDAHITLHANSEVLSFEQRSDSVDVLTAGADRFAARALIAADGLWSRLRNQVCATQPLRGTGKCAYRGVAQRSQFPADLAANDVHIWLSPGAHVVHYPVRGGREIAVVVIVDDAARSDTWSAAAPDGWLAQRAAVFPESLRTLLLSVDSWRMWPLQTLAPLETWTKGRVALAGDAAHPVLPFLAQGGVLALEDAIVLARCLAREDATVADQLTRFCGLRQARAARVARASERNGRIYHLGGPIAFARNAVLKAAPSQRLLAAYDWIYGWEI